MKPRTVRVRIEWAKEKMSHMPEGTYYTTVAKFSEDGADWPRVAWSIVLEFECPPSPGELSQEARARFLMSDAPTTRLRPGQVFEMYEGRTRTAKVTVIE